jgi:hypothetical protein
MGQTFEKKTVVSFQVAASSNQLTPLFEVTIAANSCLSLELEPTVFSTSSSALTHVAVTLVNPLNMEVLADLFERAFSPAVSSTTVSFFNVVCNETSAALTALVCLKCVCLNNAQLLGSGAAQTQPVTVANSVLSNYRRTWLLFSSSSVDRYVYEEPSTKVSTIPAKGTGFYGIMFYYNTYPKAACYINGSISLAAVNYGFAMDGGLYASVLYSSAVGLYSAGSTVADISFSPVANSDSLVAKFDQNGIVQWAGRIAGNGSDTITAVAVDASNSAYVCGYTSASSSLYAYNGAGAATSLYNIGIGGQSDSFVVKYTSLGAIECFALLGNALNDQALAVAVGPSAVFCGGTTSKSTTYFDFKVRDFNAKVSSFYIANSTNSTFGAYICKLNHVGDVSGTQWVASVNSTASDYTYSLGCDNYGNVYALVDTLGSASVYQAISTTASKTFQNTTATNNLVLVKLNANGGYVWAANITGSSITTGGRSHLTVHNNELYVHVTTTGGVTVYDASGVGTSVAAASISQVVCKYTSGGQLAWCTWITGITGNVQFDAANLFAASVYLKMTFSKVLTIYATNATILVGNTSSDGSVLIKYSAEGEAAVVSRIDK